MAGSSFVFDVDNQGVDAPPVLFKAVRVPCACGRSLGQCRYTFFPGSVFVHGVCEACGPQSAIFAPDAPVAAGADEWIAREMRRLSGVAREYGLDTREIVEGFVKYLADVAADTSTAAA